MRGDVGRGLRTVWKTLRELPISGKIGLALLGVFVAVALLAPWLSPYSPTAQDQEHLLEGVSRAHWLGTDEQGSDVLSMLIHGARLALYISTRVVVFSMLVGTALGIIAGYFGGWVNEVIMRVVNIFLAFPGLLLNLAIVAVVRKPGIEHLIFALSINGWVGYARVARGQVLSVREREYVEAARAIGASPWRIMNSHIEPNIRSPIIVQATFGFGGVILVESALSFLGLGPQVPYTWGSLLDQGQTYMWSTSRLAIAPGVAIAMVVLGCNLLGDGLRDVLDPKRVR